MIHSVQAMTRRRGVLDREFDTAALAGLREAVLGCAAACGMPEGRAIDVMLATLSVSPVRTC